MERILLVASSLDYSGAARQLATLATGLPRERFNVHVCVLGKDGPLGAELRESGIDITVLGWKRLFDPKPLWQWRQLVRSLQPGIIHAWGPEAARIVLLAARARQHRLLVSAPLTTAARSAFPWFERWLLGRADCIVCSCRYESQRCQALGVPAGKLALIPPGLGADASTVANLPGIPANRRLVACVGPLEPHKGFRDAIWGFDILQYVYEDLDLAIAGSGSDQERLNDFASGTGGREHIHFLGRLPSVSGLYHRAEVVWVPSVRPGGINVALEAMAAGKPVIASRLPGLMDVVTHGETGYLIRPGDKVGMARHTRRLLDDADLRHRLGRAAHERVRQHFGATALIERYARLYTGAGAVSRAG